MSQLFCKYTSTFLNPIMYFIANIKRDIIDAMVKAKRQNGI